MATAEKNSFAKHDVATPWRTPVLVGDANDGGTGWSAGWVRQYLADCHDSGKEPNSC